MKCQKHIVLDPFPFYHCSLWVLLISIFWNNSLSWSTFSVTILVLLLKRPSLLCPFWWPHFLLPWEMSSSGSLLVPTSSSEHWIHVPSTSHCYLCVHMFTVQLTSKLIFLSLKLYVIYHLFFKYRMFKTEFKSSFSIYNQVFSSSQRLYIYYHPRWTMAGTKAVAPLLCWHRNQKK